MPGEYLQCAGEFAVVASKPRGGWFGVSSEKQTPYIQIRFTVEDGIDQGKEITWFGYLSEKAIDRTIKALVEAFGFNGDLNDLYTGKTTFEDMQARITTDLESYGGKQRCKVKWLNPIEYSGEPSITHEAARMLIAGLNKRAKAAAAMAGAGTAQAKPPTPPAGPDVPEDDVPF